MIDVFLFIRYWSWNGDYYFPLQCLLQCYHGMDILLPVCIIPEAPTVGILRQIVELEVMSVRILSLRCAYKLERVQRGATSILTGFHAGLLQFEDVWVL